MKTLIATLVLCSSLWAQTRTNMTLETDQTVTGAKTFKAHNGVHFCDQYGGDDISAKLNSCIADVIAAGGGVADARGMVSGTISTEVGIGNSSAVGVTLLLPVVATWSVSIANGTSYGIKIYDKSSMIGSGGTSNGLLMLIAASSSSTNVVALVGTDPSPSGGASYIRAENFMVSNTVSATLGRGAFVAQHLFDNSTFRNIAVRSSGVGAKIYDACCGTSFYNLLADGLSAAGARPVVLGDFALGGSAATGGLSSTSFYGLSATHPGTSQFAIEIDGQERTEELQISNLYIEPHASDSSTALVKIRDFVHGVTFVGVKCNNTNSGDTQWCIDVESWAGPAFISVIGGKTRNSKLINDASTGMTVTGDSGTYGQAGFYAGRDLAVQRLDWGATAFASLGTPANGTQRYCNDCTIANPCAGSGTGAIAKRLNGTWICN